MTNIAKARMSKNIVIDTYLNMVQIKDHISNQKKTLVFIYLPFFFNYYLRLAIALVDVVEDH